MEAYVIKINNVLLKMMHKLLMVHNLCLERPISVSSPLIVLQYGVFASVVYFWSKTMVHFLKRGLLVGVFL